MIKKLSEIEKSLKSNINVHHDKLIQVSLIIEYLKVKIAFACR